MGPRRRRASGCRSRPIGRPPGGGPPGPAASRSISWRLGVTPPVGLAGLLRMIKRVAGPISDSTVSAEKAKPRSSVSGIGMAALKDELGDLLLQVVFHARMAEEAGHFDFADVVRRAISDKMVRRHPHVFGDRPRTRPPASGSAGRR